LHICKLLVFKHHSQASHSNGHFQHGHLHHDYRLQPPIPGYKLQLLLLVLPGMQNLHCTGRPQS
jgi:hypothetical protein